MEKKTALFLFSTLLSLSCFIPESSATKQSAALFHIYREKLKSIKGIDRSYFNGSHHSHEVKIHPQQGLKDNDRIERLPGQPHVQFKQYGGYVTVDQVAGRAFYYYFVEAQHSEKSLPLLLWLNGGPSCSSLGYGAMEELGPFRVHSDGKTLYENKFAWNNAANVLFLESPAGVGFSYSNTTADFVGDRRTAIDNCAFLLNWLERFPEYQNRDFYIAGESYAGHYVPQLAHTILYHNNKAKKTIINLKGIIIGNALINDATDFKGMYEYYESHALVSDEITDEIMKYCNFDANEQLDECTKAYELAGEILSSINIDNIYAPLCSSPNLTEYPKNGCLGNEAMNFDPCTKHYVYAYMNRPEVQKALHANVTKLPYDWQLCSNTVFAEWQDRSLTVLPLLKELMTNGLRVWIYSGDIDGNLPVTSTKLSIKQLKIPIKTSWRPWYLYGEVGGYTQVYKGNLTFATVRGQDTKCLVTSLLEPFPLSCISLLGQTSLIFEVLELRK